MNLPPGELIDDKEVAGLDEDRLGHDDVAQQLSALVCSVPTPSNVALYGPWGSGKSGIGNLLATKLKTVSGVKFVRFDAFKYAENPLRRNFISVVATALNVQESRFHEDLYRGRTTTDFSIPARKLFSLLRIFALVVLVAVFVSSLAIWIVAALQGKDVFEELIRIGTATLPASLVPASLLTAVIALVGKTFTSEKRVERAESDEEFETLLSALVQKSRADRLVIFVDELDRCSSDDVVETLNAIRTFLGVHKCIFVVAADQQVLERALTDSLSQPTPVDALNPYYSAGSAYLDKVFQYQVVVPPLMPQSIISFVVNLLDGRPGVWEQIDVPVVASILIPSHVRSPRRVKNLLNSFVLSFRLAESRVRSKQLDVDVLDSVDELARLVCLRVEFPLFARDLVVDPALSEYVRALAEPNDSEDSVWERYPYVSQATRQVAREYSSAQRPVDRLLVDDEEPHIAEVNSAQGQQLIDYLRRTRSVTGPTKALLHLQNTGSLFGLPAAVAEQLERDAQNASLAAVSKTFTTLDMDARAGAIQLLVQQARAALGLEAPNIASTILAAVAYAPEAARPYANEIALVVSTALGDSPEDLTSSTAAGAWEVATAGSRIEADMLGRLVLKSDLATTDDDLLQRILQAGERSVALSRRLVSDLMVHRFVVENPDVVVDSLIHIDQDQRVAVLEACEAELITRLIDVIEDFNEAQEARKTIKTAAPGRTSVPPPTPEDEAPDEDIHDPSELLTALGRLMEALDGSDSSLSVVLRTLLKVGKKETRDIVGAHIGKVTIRDDEVVALVLEQVVPRTTGQWPKWLDSLSSGAFVSGTRSESGIVELTRVMWSRATAPGADLNEDELLAAALSLATLIDRSDEGVRSHVVESIDLGEHPTDEEELAGYVRRIAVAETLARAGVIQPRDLAAKRAETVAKSLEEELEESIPEGVMAEWVLSEYAALLNGPQSDLSDFARSRLVAVGSGDTWLSQHDEARLRVRLLERADIDVSGVPTVSASAVDSARAELSQRALFDLEERWLRGTNEPFDKVAPVLRIDIRSAAPSSFLSAVAAWRSKLTTSEQYALLESFISNEVAAVQPPQVLRAVGLNDLDELSVASLLVDRYQRATTNENRRSVLRLAELASFSRPAPRKRVLLEVIVPMLTLNASAADIALSYAVKLGKPVPQGVKKPLGEAILGAGSRFPGATHKAEEALRKLGYATKRKGMFGHNSVVDTSE